MALVPVLRLYRYNDNAHETPSVLPDAQRILNFVLIIIHNYQQRLPSGCRRAPHPHGLTGSLNSGLLGHLGLCPPLAVLSLGGAGEEPVSASDSSCDLPLWPLPWPGQLSPPGAGSRLVGCIPLAVTPDSESRAPVLRGGGFHILPQVPCGFSSHRHFSFWSPSLSPPARLSSCLFPSCCLVSTL